MTEEKPEKIQLPPNRGVQEFLNDPWSSEHGWIKGTVTYERWSKLRPNIDLFVGDCSRVVSIDFDPIPDRGVNVAQMIDLRLEKLRRLHTVMSDFVAEAMIALEKYRGTLDKDGKDPNDTEE